MGRTLHAAIELTKFKLGNDRVAVAIPLMRPNHNFPGGNLFPALRKASPSGRDRSKPLPQAAVQQATLLQQGWDNKAVRETDRR